MKADGNRNYRSN